MFGLLSCLNVLRHPRKYYRERFKIPVIRFVHETVQLYKRKTETGVNNAKEVIFRGSIVALVTALLVWLSVFMYIAFYYAYVPAITHERPVYLQFSPCKEGKGMCSFPSAYIQLTKKQQLLMLGQSYKVHLDLEMPESPTNRDLGMFMVCADFQGNFKKILASSCRSAMLHYRSSMLDFMYKLVFSPFYLLGASEEKQTLHIELFADYEETDDLQVTDVFIEIRTTHIEIYSAKFLINAEFAGLRYLLFHWPVLSAAIGITSNLFFIAVVCMMSWYQIIHSEEYKRYTITGHIQELEEDSGDDSIQNRNVVLADEKGFVSDSTSSMEDASLLGETKSTVRRRHSTSGREYLEDVPQN